jgi:hypothetical protein
LWDGRRVARESAAASRGPASSDRQVITAIPATLFAWIIGTGIAMLAADP